MIKTVVQAKVPEVPSNIKNSMYGNYQGYYAKTYNYELNDEEKKRSKSVRPATMARGREVDNQLGMDAVLEAVSPQVLSPIKFEKQLSRQIFNTRNGCMHVNAEEKRFDVINHVTTANSKYPKALAPNFKHQGLKTIGFKQFENSSQSMNVHHIYFDPKHHLTMHDFNTGLPNFERYITREHRKEVLGISQTPQPYSPVEVKHGFHQAHKDESKIVPFKM